MPKTEISSNTHHSNVVLRIVEDGTCNKYGKDRPGADADGYRVSTNEALFLRCVLQCQMDYGIAPAANIRAIIGLSPSIGIIVDYDYVKRLMCTKMPLLNSTFDQERRALCGELAGMALKAARTKLAKAGVIGFYDPFVWWTGEPVEGVTHASLVAA